MRRNSRVKLPRRINPKRRTTKTNVFRLFFVLQKQEDEQSQDSATGYRIHKPTTRRSVDTTDPAQ